MTITWEALAALCAFIALLAAAIIGSARLMITSAVAEFENRFFEKLNFRYPNMDRCDARHVEIARRLDKLEETPCI